MSEYGIRHKDRCCPEYYCLYEDWDYHVCPECGAICDNCSWKETMIKLHCKEEYEE